MHADVNSYYKFNSEDLLVAAAGQSVIDQPRLHIYSIDEADLFIKSYGFDYSNESDRTKLWYFYRRALVLLTDKLKFSLLEIPKNIRQQEELGDLRLLLVYSSGVNADIHTQKWSCAILRAMHAFIHSETDLFAQFSETIQKQILTPFEESVVNEGKLFLRSFRKEGHARIELAQFQTKPFKTSSSSVIKLLAKREAAAMHILDKIGIRFVTNSVFEAFQVLRFLIDENLISYAHIMPDQSSNNLYPVKEFVDVCNKLDLKHGASDKDQLVKLSPEKMDRLLLSHLKNKNGFMNLFRKENIFSSKDFRYIKFICRKLIKIESDVVSGKSFSFFYPFEVQITDRLTFEKMQQGDTGHSSYKMRQIDAARKRVFSL